MDTRVRVMVVGGLYGSQPVGRELVLRLARHLASGWAKKDREIQKLLQNTKIFLVPAVDTDGFDRAESGNEKLYFFFLHLYCNYCIFKCMGSSLNIRNMSLNSWVVLNVI